MKIIGLDIGTVNTSITVDGKTHILPSQIEQVNDYTKEDKSLNKITVDGIEYVIGQGKYENSIFKYRKSNFSILLTYALTKYCKHGDEVSLVIGTPVEQFKQPMRSELENIIKSHKTTTAYYGRKERTVTIKNFVVRPEGYGVFKLYEHDKRIVPGAETVIIDIGGKTIDVSVYNTSGKFLHEKVFNLNYGLNLLYETLKTELFTHKISRSVEDIQKHFDYHNSVVSTPYTIIGVPKGILNQVLKRVEFTIYNDINARIDSLETYNIVMCGGGAYYFGDMYDTENMNFILNRDVSANSKTFYMIGRGLYEKGNKIKN